MNENHCLYCGHYFSRGIQLRRQHATRLFSRNPNSVANGHDRIRRDPLGTGSDTPNPVGEWNLKTDAQGQITNFTLTITKEGEAFKGKVASEQYGAQELTDLKYENGTLTYTRNLEIGGQGDRDGI